MLSELAFTEAPDAPVLALEPASDSDPVGEDARNNDLTLTASLGWKY